MLVNQSRSARRRRPNATVSVPADQRSIDLSRWSIREANDVLSAGPCGYGHSVTARSIPRSEEITLRHAKPGRCATEGVWRKPGSSSAGARLTRPTATTLALEGARAFAASAPSRLAEAYLLPSPIALPRSLPPPSDNPWVGSTLRGIAPASFRGSQDAGGAP